MKINFEKSSNVIEKNKIKEIEQKLQYAKDHAFFIDDFKKLGEEIKDLPYEKQKEIYYEKIKDSIAEFKTITDFRIAGEILGWDKKLMKGYNNYLHYIIDHENAHLNVAEKEGAIVYGYNIIMVKDNKGVISIHPAVRYDVPENLSDDEKYRIEMLSVIAPETYGNFLSHGDKDKIKFLDKKYNKDRKTI